MIKNINNNDKLIVSHIADIDGMGSVVLSKIYFKDIDYILIDIEELIEVLKLDLSSYKDIYICDISMREECIKYLLDNENLSKKIHHFDHHESEVVNNKYDFINEVISINDRLTCGTELFYNYLLTLDNKKCIDNNFIKEFVESTRSNDTWDISSKLRDMGVNLGTLHNIVGPQFYINLIANMDIKDNFYIPEDYIKLIDNENDKRNNYINKCKINSIVTNLDGYRVCVSISEEYRSFVGNSLCTDDIDYTLIINFYRNRCSLRCRKDDIDVGLIAKDFSPSGGGHKKAAGFNIDEYSIKKLEPLIIEYLKKKR
jgi:oligoribonuclease NrnB/cAMP/cGMP phosphodiesterase (DHH superfamily)